MAMAIAKKMSTNKMPTVTQTTTYLPHYHPLAPHPSGTDKKMTTKLPLIYPPTTLSFPASFTSPTPANSATHETPTPSHVWDTTTELSLPYANAAIQNI